MPVAAGPKCCPDVAPSLGGVRHGAWLAAGLVLLLGLRPPAAQAQEWHEFYANGQQALRNGQPARAADLFRRAIQRRPQPGVSVPTYGTNLEPQYFPYLRLADAYFRLEAFDDALKALETSARFGVEPAAERSTLEARVRAALEAKQPTAKPIPPPAPAPALPPPRAPPESTIRAAEPVRDTGTAPPATTSPPPASPIASTRAAEPVRRGLATLDLTSEPAGAQVFVDNESVGRTDPETGRLRLSALRPGRHRVRLSAEGHDDLVREITLAAEPVSFRGVLTRQAPAPGPQSPVQSPEPASRRSWGPVWVLILLVLLAPAAWLWNRSRRRNQREPTPTPSLLSTASGPGSYEDFPVEFGDYRLLRRIGRGGMATVYEAERRGERFALKRPLTGFLDNPIFLERFQREAELGRALHHPNIIRIFDRGQVGGVPYFTMELVDGETLRARLDRDGRLDPRFATKVTSHVAEALDYAHHKGVIHRDLKPSNIMLERSGGIKVMDYGIARALHLHGVTATGGFLGTPQYAAPEAVDALTEPRSDLYSLGIVFFEMLTGALPFRGETALAILHAHRVTPPPPPSSVNYAVAAELDRVVLGLLSKEASERPTAEQLLNQLADYLGEAR